MILKGEKLLTRPKRYTAATLPPSLPIGKSVVVDNVEAVFSGGEYIALRNNNSNSFAVVGDSYSALLTENSTATRILWNNYCYLYYAFTTCDRRANLLSMNAVSGKGFFSAVDSFDTQLTAAIASGAKNLIFMGGINDVYGGSSAADIIVAARAFFKRVKLSGMRLFLCTQPGPDATYGLYSASKAGAMERVQEFYRQYALLSDPSSVILVDCAALGNDPSAATPGYRAGYSRVDKIHPSPACACVIGTALGAAMKSVLRPVGELNSSNSATYALSSDCPNMLPNGLFVSGPSGAPTGFTITNDAGVTTGTKASVARADDYGNDLVIPITGITTAGNGVTVEKTVGITTGINDGDSFILEFETTLKNPVAMRGVWVRFGLYTATNGVSWWAGWYVEANPIPNRTITQQFRSPPIKYNASTMGSFTTGLQMYIKAVGDAASSSCEEFRIGRVSIKKVIA